MNSIRNYMNLLKNFFHFLLPENYEQAALRKEPVIATFMKRFKKSYFDNVSLQNPISN